MKKTFSIKATLLFLAILIVSPSMTEASFRIISLERTGMRNLFRPGIPPRLQWELNAAKARLAELQDVLESVEDDFDEAKREQESLEAYLTDPKYEKEREEDPDIEKLTIGLKKIAEGIKAIDERIAALESEIAVVLAKINNLQAWYFYFYGFP